LMGRFIPLSLALFGVTCSLADDDWIID
jgi:hypothetical protein